MKNNKGFFLAETIVMIALVTTIMAFVYPNVSKLYENYKNRVMYYDQTEDLYTLRAFYEANKNSINDKTGDGFSCKKLECTAKIDNSSDAFYIGSDTSTNIAEVYIMNYMSSPSSTYYNFNRYLKKLKKTTNDDSSYRLIAIFGLDTDGDGNKDLTRYASIKIDNPNIGMTCS